MKFTVIRLVKKFNVSFGTRQFISLFTAVLPSLCPEDEYIQKSVDTPPPLSTKIHGIILQKTVILILHTVWLEVKSDM